MATKKISKRLIEAKIGFICSKAIQNLQINVMDLKKIHKVAITELKACSTTGDDLDAVISKVREYAMTIAHNT